MKQTHDKEADRLYAEAREVVRWGLANGLLHAPPDEPSDDDDARDAMHDSIEQVARLSSAAPRKKVDLLYDDENEVQDEVETADETADAQDDA